MTTPCPSCIQSLAISASLVAAFLGILVAAAINDVRSMTIPNGLSIALIALYPFYVFLAGANWLDGLFAGGIVLAVGIVFFAFNWLGGGDVKLLAATSLWAGTNLLVPALFITVMAGGLLCLLIWATKGGPQTLIHRFYGGRGAASTDVSDETSRTGIATASVPYAVAILAGGVFVTYAQLLPIIRLAETIQ